MGRLEIHGQRPRVCQASETCFGNERGDKAKVYTEENCAKQTGSRLRKQSHASYATYGMSTLKSFKVSLQYLAMFVSQCIGFIAKFGLATRQHSNR